MMILFFSNNQCCHIVFDDKFLFCKQYENIHTNRTDTTIDILVQ